MEICFKLLSAVIIVKTFLTLFCSCERNDYLKIIQPYNSPTPETGALVVLLNAVSIAVRP